MRPTKRFIISGLLLLTLAVSSCTAQNSETVVTPPSPATSSLPPKPVESTITVPSLDNLSTDLEKSPLKVTSTDPIEEVVWTGESAAFNETVVWKKVSEKEWVAIGVLPFSTPFSFTVKDNTQTKTYSGTTVTPQDTVSPTLFPYEGTMGAGMPITVNFKEAIKDKAWVEKHLVVKTTPETAGSWAWIEDSRVVWKPDEFWKPGTKVSVHVDVEGIETAPNQWGKRDVTGEFVIGRSLVMKIDDASKRMTVIEDGAEINSFPVSLGKPGHLTSSGINIVYEKENPTRMVGDDYNLLVNYAQRYNTTGEYLHSAPWSVGDQGRRNVSHGCVNIAPQNAKWLYEKTLLGDIVEITGTGRQADKWDGMGAVWNYSLEEWKSLSAL